MSVTKFPKPTSPGEGRRNTFDVPIALGSEGIPQGYVPVADGTGGVEWRIGAGGLDFQESVLDKDVTDPTTLTPAEGDRYIVGVGAIGTWSGHDNEITQWHNGAWEYYAPSNGTTTFVEDENRYYVYDGSAWNPLELVVQQPVLFSFTAQLEVLGGRYLSYYGVPSNVAGALLAKAGKVTAVTVNNTGTDGFTVKVYGSTTGLISTLTVSSGNKSAVDTSVSQNVQAGEELYCEVSLGKAIQPVVTVEVSL